ncbi:stress-response A/B barrel domain-containing protein UP3 isoform X2 [Asparagus officinalis]|uniref:stress-response A/B barrel domain-containing protein UP3 isoform X2 n=1 Tax=Asparagus officinalis TaxID=4686 RepID=UPI00098E433B|nr:stress-response A/B barrel domain-containing protein UP3 isoform X2 [Asparagus officinalis]
MPLCIPTLSISPFHQTLASSLRIFSTSKSHPARYSNGRGVGFGLGNRERRCFASVNGVSSRFDESENGTVKKRNVVEHILLLRAKSDLSDVEEKDMLDNLYTSQYQMRGILAISLGRIEEPNDDNFTHAVYMRFQTKEDLSKFYVNSYYSQVLKEHVMPYCDDFNYGAECILLISMAENTLAGAIEDALATLRRLIADSQSLIVQATEGLNFNKTESIYTHAAVIRFPSLDALEIFRGSSEYKEMWRHKIQPITKKTLLIHFVVDPVGTQLM